MKNKGLLILAAMGCVVMGTYDLWRYTHSAELSWAIFMFGMAFVLSMAAVARS